MLKEDRIYVASRASLPERAAMWRELRASGWNIISTWIDESGEGETDSFSDLWLRIAYEVNRSQRFVLYAEPDDFPLKGALVEVGMAISLGKPIFVCLPGVVLDGRTMRPVGSWLSHPSVKRIEVLTEALDAETK